MTGNLLFDFVQRRDRRVRAGAGRDEVVEDRPEAADRGAHVSRRDVVRAALHRLRDLVRREVLGDHLALVALERYRVAQVVARLLEHARDERVELRRRGVPVFGPGREAAQIEGSKAFAKDVMAAAGVPTARTLAVARPPCVVKADGLAAGKGVWVCHTQAELDRGLRAAEALGQPFHVEEFLEGEEVSVFALCDGKRALPLPAAQDYKRIGDADTGPNTGGMGSYSPVPQLADEAAEELVSLVHEPVLRELGRRGMPFTGALFAGLMLTAEGPRVLEYNCRFGDPETQSLLPRLEGD